MSMIGGTVVTNSGNVVQLPNLSPVELKKAKSMVDQGIPFDQVSQSITTTQGDTLASAIDKVNESIAINGGSASPHMPSSIDPNTMAQMLGIAGPGSYGSETPKTPAPASSGTPWWFWIIAVLLFFMMWQSSPEGSVGAAKAPATGGHGVHYV